MQAESSYDSLHVPSDPLPHSFGRIIYRVKKLPLKFGEEPTKSDEPRINLGAAPWPVVTNLKTDAVDWP